MKSLSALIEDMYTVIHTKENYNCCAKYYFLMDNKQL